MKKKYICAIVYIVLSSFFVAFAAYNIHFAIVDKSMCSFDIFKSTMIIASLKTENIQRLFFIINGFNMLFVFYALFGHSLISSSEKVKDVSITPQIKTPAPADSTLFGSAKWLPKNKFSKTFKCIDLKKHPSFKQLVKRRCDDN